MLVPGKNNQEIAAQLTLTEVTVRSHISRILAKLGLANRVQALLLRAEVSMCDDTGHYARFGNRLCLRPRRRVHEREGERGRCGQGEDDERLLGRVREDR